MHKNVGSTEQLLRVAVGLGTLALAYRRRSWWGMMLAAAPIYSVITRYCPINEALGINHYGAKKKGHGSRSRHAASAA